MANLIERLARVNTIFNLTYWDFTTPAKAK